MGRILGWIKSSLTIGENRFESGKHAHTIQFGNDSLIYLCIINRAENIWKSLQKIAPFILSFFHSFVSLNFDNIYFYLSLIYFLIWNWRTVSHSDGHLWAQNPIHSKRMSTFSRWIINWIRGVDVFISETVFFFSFHRWRLSLTVHITQWHKCYQASETFSWPFAHRTFARS